jgi:hypothetical protein
MAWMEWITPRHVLFTHLPVAVALLLPLPLIAAQRPGRGIRPWWTTCRFLSWAGVIGGIVAAVIGLIHARSLGLLNPSAFMAPRGEGLAMVFRQHQIYSLVSLVLGLLCLRSVYRKRQDYQGIGVLSLFLGLLWSASSIMAVYRGDQLAWATAPVPQFKKESPAPAPAVEVAGPVDAEAKAPLRALDYPSLVPLHGDFVKSMPHGNRWIRVWANPEAVQAYRQGSTLPEGSFLVMNSVENRWGRPGPEPGPLYALEIKAGGKPSLTFYWPRVPEMRRNETRGADRAYWRGDAPELQACLACHAEGAAPAKDRSRWAIATPKVKSLAPALD